MVVELDLNLIRQVRDKWGFQVNCSDLSTDFMYLRLFAYPFAFL